MYDLVRGVEARYKFLQAPRTLQEFDLNSGVTFVHGTFRDAVIDKFQAFQQGLACEASISTDILDAFYDDLFEWVAGEFEARFVPSFVEARAYLSNIEIQMDHGLEDKLAILNDLGHQIGETMRSYGLQNIPDFKPTQVSLHYDVSGETTPKSVAFVFDRRAERPFSEKLYFSSAPLSTQDHITILQALEALLLS